MTQSEIKAMFEAGKRKVWIARRWSDDAVVHGNLENAVLKGSTGEPERRRIFAIRSRDIVWSREGKANLYMPLPKSFEVIEARQGYLRFQYEGDPDRPELGKGPMVELVLTQEDVP
jgi:hypothetical protein